MSTRSNIGILNENNTITWIYCHFDGYPSHVGKILYENYNNEKKIRELLNLGDISSLGKTLEPHPLIKKYGFDAILNPNVPEEEKKETEDTYYSDKYTSAYHRDRKEDLIINTASDEIQYSKDFGINFKYLFKDGKWYYNYSDGTPFRELVLNNEE